MGLGISSVGIPDISPYTKSEQPRVAGKQKCEKRLRCLGIYSNSASRASKLLVGSATAAAVVGIAELQSFHLPCSY